MGKKPKPNKEEEEAGGGSADIFKVLFGRYSTEEAGLGLGSKTENGENESHQEFHKTETNLDLSEVKKKKKKKREKGTKPDSDAEKLDSDSENFVEVKKMKREREKSPNLVVDSIGTDEGKKRKKEKEKEILDLDVVSIGKDEVKRRKKEKEEEKPNLNVVSNENSLNKREKKKKRKRDEIEEQYEARVYGLDEKIEGKDEDVKSKKVGEKRKSMDDPAEMMVSKEGFDDESKLLRTVFVGNLLLKTKKKALLKEFSRFGEVESVRIRSVPLLDCKMPRKGAIITGKINDTIDSVNAYIVFKEEKSAQDSLSHNMAMVGGNHIRVDMACPPRKKLKGGDSTTLYDHKRTVFVGNLPFDVKDEELYQLFCGINQLESSIEAVRVIRDPHTSVGKGIAYVLLKTREAASLLVRKKHLKLRDRDLRLYHAKSDSLLSKKRELSVASANQTPSKRMAISPSRDHLDRNNLKAKVNLSYQGLRANKSGVQKKESSRPRTSDRGMQNTKTVGGGPERKVRSSKRPAVAARKAKELKVLGTPKQTGIKRKLENRTPDNSHRNKKPRKFR